MEVAVLAPQLLKTLPKFFKIYTLLNKAA